MDHGARRRRVVPVAAVTLHAAAAGTGPAITFIHGFGLHGGMWAARVAEFSRTHRAIAIDLPGFGRSPDTADKRPMPDLIARALDARGVRETALVGLSLGGAVAIDLALAHPSRITALVLADALLIGYPAALETWDACVALARADDCAGALEHWLTDGVFARARLRPPVWSAIRAMLAAYDCAHWTGAAALRCMEEPAAFNEALRGFLGRDVGGPGSPRS